MGHTRICDAYRQLVRLYYSVSRAIKVLLHLLLSNFVRTWDYGTLYGFTTAVLAPWLAHTTTVPYFTHKCAGCNMYRAVYRARGPWAWRVACGDFLPSSILFYCICKFARSRQRQPTRPDTQARARHSTTVPQPSTQQLRLRVLTPRGECTLYS